MASKAFLIAVFFATVAAPTMAAYYMVGENDGWKLGVNYTQWAADKTFYVGDTLMFMYDKASHNVLKVNGSDFQKCLTSNTTGLLSSGNDVITLAKPGKKWYICAVEDHCTKGMKLVINVSEAAAASPLPPPKPGSSGASKISTFKSFGWMLAALTVFKIILA
ncbi:basic blue -like [Olea europaea subsp. europaea]|uniref:Basic blue -like n=1 Tax=Olea europaea subsp. europaea TaxID=158383 RepID=A0A8S0PGY8_OLEEU|nr:basic blue -like [Olea europaea subsp. europaea]